MMMWMNLNFQNPNSINMFKLTMFNNFLMIIIINVFIIMILMLKFNFKKKFNNKNMFENQKMELMWTIIPMMMIMLITMMSIKILYNNNEIKKNFINIKIFSNQWFWNYEYTSLKKNFNSYLMINNKFNFFMMETDNNIIVPFNYQILMSLSSMDVIHSWTIPSLNLKMDAIPNQMNNFKMMILKSTIMYGQCSEICGMNHSFMPIKMESINLKNFIMWI